LVTLGPEDNAQLVPAADYIQALAVEHIQVQVAAHPLDQAVDYIQDQAAALQLDQAVDYIPGQAAVLRLDLVAAHIQAQVVEHRLDQAEDAIVVLVAVELINGIDQIQIASNEFKNLFAENAS
jgi:hypothetical protein